MASSNKLHSIASPVLLVLLLSVASATANVQTDCQLEFNYVQGAKNGPENWGTLKPEWRMCRDGRMQSPVGISRPNVRPMPTLGRLDTNYRPQEANVVNSGHDISVRFKDDAGNLTIGLTTYNFKELHWHVPSEHTIDGKRYDMELHMVHESDDKRVAVVAILYILGHHDEFLRRLSPYILFVTGKPGKEVKVHGEVDPTRILEGSDKYYRYMGSLTTPPCTERVTWTVMEKVKTVSQSQMETLTQAVCEGAKNNARPLQPLNGRMIGENTPPHQNHKTHPKYKHLHASASTCLHAAQLWLVDTYCPPVFRLRYPIVIRKHACH